MTPEQATEMIGLLREIAENTRSKPKSGTANPNKGKRQYGQYKHVYLTDEEMVKLQGTFGGKLNAAIQMLDEYLEKSGRSYRSHYLVMLSWVKENVLGATPATTISKELF